jgi:hypothetical protein
MLQTDSIDLQTSDGAVPILSLVYRATTACSLEQLAADSLPGLAELMEADRVVFYVTDPRLTKPCLFCHDRVAQPPGADDVEELLAGCLDQLRAALDLGPIELPPELALAMGVDLLVPLQEGKKHAGVVGLGPGAVPAPEVAESTDWILRILTHQVMRLIESEKSERQLKQLNTYLTVSSMLAQPLGLPDLLESILYSCLEVTSAEEGSVLLLDDEKRNFRFYQIEGPSKPVLKGAKFPADQGLAGAVLASQRSEIVNDVQNDPRFYGKIDSDSGFTTRNMIVVPLTAGDERIGVLNVLNKAAGGAFAAEDQVFLQSIAEEVAFAIRNAKVFEYVVNSYCKQRQGLNSCKGCKRPLGAWTPCVKYREAEQL